MIKSEPRTVTLGDRADEDSATPLSGDGGAELRENPTLAARLRRRLIYSLLGLIALAVPMGFLVAYGS